MELLLFRHGIAADESPDGSDDARPLTDEGRDRTLAAAKGLAAIIDPPDVIFTSPKVRAEQTAAIVGKVMDRKPLEMKELAGSSIEAIISRLAKVKEPRVMIVGHEPTFSRLVETLCTGGKAEQFVQLKKAGCACVLIDGPFATLQWLATPKMLRGIK